MTPLLLAAAVAVAAGAVIAVSSHRARAALMGLLVALIAAPVAAAPIDILPLAARLVAAVLAVYLLWIAARGRDVEVETSRLGWAAEAAFAAAAAIVGYAATGLGLPASGAPETHPAASVLPARGTRPVARGADTLRLGIGLLLLLSGSCLVWAAVAGPLGAVEDLAVGGLLVAAAAGIGVLTLASRTTSGSLELAMAGPTGRRRATAEPEVGPADGARAFGQAHRIGRSEGVEAIGFAEPRAASAAGLAETAALLEDAPAGIAPNGPPDAADDEPTVAASGEDGAAGGEGSPGPAVGDPAEDPDATERRP